MISRSAPSSSKVNVLTSWQSKIQHFVTDKGHSFFYDVAFDYTLKASLHFVTREKLARCISPWVVVINSGPGEQHGEGDFCSRQR